MRLLACAAAAVLATACVPITPYRFTGMTPAARPIAWDGYPSHAGEVHAEVSMSHTIVVENLFPQIHDTALRVAATDVEGNASLTPIRGLDVGVRWSYAAYRWTEPTAVGTMALPSSPSLVGVGPEVHGALFLDHHKHVALGLAANLMHYDVPYAAYALAKNGSYVLDHTGSDSDWTMQVGLYPSYSFGPDGKYGTVFAMIGAHTSFKNDGFATTPSSGSTIEEDGFVPIIGQGYGVHTPYFHASVMAYFPLGSTIDWGPGVMVTLGLDLPLWHPRGGRQQPAVLERP
jgi:hypothetical protein